MRLLTTILLFLTIRTQATTYYVKAAGGTGSGLDDANAWSLAKLNATALSAGDIVLFKRGDKMRGTLIPPSSGASGNPITYGAYGTGAEPIISAFVVVGSWTSLGANQWSATVTTGSSKRVNMVTVGGVLAPIGRYPNAGFYDITGHTASGSPTSVGVSSTVTGTMPSAINWAASGGANIAEIVIRKNPYIYDRDVITAQSSNTITYKNTSIHGDSQPYDGYGYFVQNDIRACDVQNEWMHDATGNIMRMYSTTNPGSINVEVATAERTVYLNSKSYLTFNNIVFEGANNNIIESLSGTRLTYNACTFRFAGFNGFETFSTSYLTLNGCVFRDIMNNGTYLRSSNATLTGNTFSYCGMVIGQGANDNQAKQGMLIAGASNVVEYNYLRQIGYNGIYMNGNGARIRYNRLDSICMIAGDGGAIYASGGNSDNNSDRQIYGNIINYVKGPHEGANYGTDGGGYCIYMDDNSRQVIIDNNYCARASDAGIYCHNTQYITITNNNLFDNAGAQLKFAKDVLGDEFSNMVYNNNIMVARNGQEVVAWYGPTDNFASIHTSAGNIVSKLAAPSSAITVRIFSGGYGSPTNYSLASWQSAKSRETGSTVAPSGFVSTTPGDIISQTNPSQSVVNKILAGIYKSRTATFSGEIDLASYGSAILFRTGDIVSTGSGGGTIKTKRNKQAIVL